MRCRLVYALHMHIYYIYRIFTINIKKGYTSIVCQTARNTTHVGHFEILAC